MTLAKEMKKGNIKVNELYGFMDGDDYILTMRIKR